MSEALLPCPSCGSEASVDKTNYYFEDTGEHAMSAFVVSCRSCGMKTAQYRTEESAVERWNRRAERTCRKVPGRMKYGRRMPKCSECGQSLGDERWLYCPHCGARIVGEEDS